MKPGLLIVFMLFLTSSINCGKIDISNGGGGTPNDARPTTTPLKQSALTSENGKTVSGSASVFFSGTGNYIIRLEGLSVPNESGLSVLVYATPGGKIATFPLRAASGSQNYPLSNGVNGLTFNSVSIFSNVNNLNYATALFQ